MGKGGGKERSFYIGRKDERREGGKKTLKLLIEERPCHEIGVVTWLCTYDCVGEGIVECSAECAVGWSL